MFNKLLLVLRLGLYSLLLHKLRSGLAVLGILIGVTAVIWLVAMGEGVSYEAQQQIKNLGANNIIIRNVKPPQSSSSRGGVSYLQYGLMRSDFDRMTSNIPTLQQAVPMREIRKEIRYRDRTVDAALVGCTPEYLELNHLHVARGRFLEDRDGSPPDNVCVLADETAKALFPFENPIGRRVQIDLDFYTVVGRTANRTASAAIGGSLEARDYNQDIYIPLNTLRARIGDTVISSRTGSREGEIVELSQITLTVHRLEQVDPTADIVRSLLARYHTGPPDYAVVVPKELLKQAEMMQMMFNVLLVVIAGISLLVGGIGIMNIMLATVTERTREIGVRRALGANRLDIIQQFLAESIVLTGVGGMLGVGLGYCCGPAIDIIRRVCRYFFPDAMATLPPQVLNLKPIIADWSVLAAFVISVAVGLCFGLYPAYRAAMMDPIEALRHE